MTPGNIQFAKTEEPNYVLLFQVLRAINNVLDNVKNQPLKEKAVEQLLGVLSKIENPPMIMTDS